LYTACQFSSTRLFPLRLSLTTGGKIIFASRCQLCTRVTSSSCDANFLPRREELQNCIASLLEGIRRGKGRVGCARGRKRRRWPQHPPSPPINIESADLQNPAWESLAGATPRPPREPGGGGCRSRLHAGVVPSTPALTCNTEKVHGVEEGRDIALTSSWARWSKSIRRRRNSNQWRISSNR
jgi:hypothetical protein